MNVIEADKLTEKCMKVILSCRNMDQLMVAHIYAERVLKKINNEIGLAKYSRPEKLIERSIGYALRKVGGYIELV